MNRPKNVACIAAISLLIATGCGIKDSIDDAKDDLENLGDELDDLGDKLDGDTTETEILAELFPDLSEEELAEISVDLSLEELIDLEAELEAVRKKAEELSEALFVDAEKKVEERNKILADHNDGFPESVSAVGTVGFADAATGDCRIGISGVLKNDTAIHITDANVEVRVDGVVQETRTACLYDGTPVDIVFLIDITGSMGSVIRSVRESVVRFVDVIASSGLTGTIGVVTFQDSVGVNVTFQQPAPPDGVERSPFFKPVSITNTADINALKSFVSRLEANMGADLPENLSGAVDFARNNTIGYTRDGQPNVIGKGGDDPPGTAPWPALASEHQVFIAMTDATFHGDGADDGNSSLLSPFVPRDIADIVESLNRTGTIVNVSDPSWVDETTSPSSNTTEVDADYFAITTGGVGEDVVLGYSLVDLELVVVANDTGLLDITLDRLLASTCFVSFTDDAIETGAAFELRIDAEGDTYAQTIAPIWL